MEILYYNDLDYSKVKKSFHKVVEQLKAGNFAGADVKKMVDTGYYRAKLDDENRLLFQFARYEGRTYLLLLEVILHHRYADSRFLNGAAVEASKMVALAKPEQVEEADVANLPYVNPRSAKFNLLDKVISFDDDQHEVFALPTPLIVIGSAGSGKTALTLEKIKTLHGNILYVTLSPYLVENSAALYYSYQYRNEDQEIDFLSFKEYVETLEIPSGRELTFRPFDAWFTRHRNTVKIRDSYKLYEEFKGVITGMNVGKEYLSREDYLALGVRQSVFLADEREQVYTLFEKYLEFLREHNYFDLNMVAVRWQPLCKPKYDFIIVDEVQDLTNAQLFLILKSLKTPGQFILCGDSNQIVHPNFFSWASVKTMFYTQDSLDNEVRILHTNYRNSPQVTELANRLLKVKNARFGSIDRESTYLVNPISTKTGEVVCLPDNAKIKQELNQKTRNSTQFAVVVMSQEDKAEARKIFQTPLLFSVQEAKGLEYENIILFNFIANKSREFIEITRDVSRAEVETDELRYARAKDKADKSLDAYKFYINSLYVAVTRAVRNLYVVESTQKHPLLELLDLINLRGQLDMAEQKSSMEEWQREARRLEMQGKNEQADLIRHNILGNQKTPWTPITLDELKKLKEEALNPEWFNKKAKDRLFDFALIYDDHNILQQLSQLKYRRADRPELERSSIFRRSYAAYSADDVKKVTENIKKYGIDYRDEFNMTPLLAALKTGAGKVTDFLLEQGAKLDLIDNFGISPFLMAFQQAQVNAGFMQQRLPVLYPKLRPETIKVKIDNHLVKINARSAEFFLLHHFLVAQTAIVMKKRDFDDRGINMDDITSDCAKYPVAILPEFRKKRTYLNSILSKNEIEREDPYNKKLFLRIARGAYVLNPDLEVLVAEDQWMNVYEMMFTEKMTAERNEALKKEALERFHRQRDEDRAKNRARQEAERKQQMEEWHRRWRW
ncbi:MAG: UvrD-helicase domain-containing protein [Saprospiraceae bacterium]|nr:UvrD-helicase domain-containing protein [Saprospiraceae bacterium]